MKKSSKLIVITLIIIMLLLLAGYSIKRIMKRETNDIFTGRNTIKSEQTNIPEEKYKENISFIRTYRVVADLNETDQTGQYNFVVVEQYQVEEPVVIKLNKQYKIEENANYEISFNGIKILEKEYSIKEIFENFQIVSVKKTNKIGLDQIQDKI
ncbi:MAG: hypothetical protein HFJ25_04890 [Clostridia bacterium]|nr:hypothetical protein [Clostridia bacterium]